MADDTRFFEILDRIDEIKKDVNQIRIDLDTHIKIHCKLKKQKQSKSRSIREKIAIIISAITTTVAIFALLPPLLP